ncbi:MULTISPECIES: EutN/CcmL family microcompartment protein [Megasphaera]|uniref:Ethanolamine utilization protein EutN n=1 Tax=Megasphaera hutchinsoni TaxID=1588748 RepID=A0A134CDG3_9FIRM|nr:MULTISPECIES: EutN/CcmL family microcompartment protein [Megasphaera]MUP47803.1 ethanolamine utilization protein EutN [Veillonellaceae bacterium M2-8]MUP59165.1 ethanolamine utilization protein EutN [Veillonellaceae bacterium M2-4]EGS31970.1 carbon dioxide concentrating mechanism protein CcmL [Megasphaera sp. UPII 135-E]KXB90164.1 putative carbon dioxide concentrating mechanism protein CcmL [Megasphaera hutchinsoni]PNH22146.1 ethanolamine utilization protein EutN [Megasphaera genomosp. type
MRIGKVTGSIVSTKKEESLVGAKLMIVQCENKDGQAYGIEEVAVDYVGAGIGEKVLIASGSAVRTSDTTKTKTIDLAIIGIIDSIQ